MNNERIWILEGKWAGMGKYVQVIYADSVETIKTYLAIWQPGLKWYRNHSYEMCRHKDVNGNPHTYRISSRDILTAGDVSKIIERRAASEARRTA